MKDKKIWTYVLIASGIALAYLCAYPPVFIAWIIPLFVLMLVMATAVTFLLFLAFFTMKKKDRVYLRSAIGAVVYAAVDFGLTILVNNVIFGAVAPWGNSIINSVLNIAFWVTMIVLIQKGTGEKFVWKPLACLLAIVVSLPVNIVLTVPNIKATGFIVSDTVDNYKKRIDAIEIYENTLETARPMTDVYTVIDDHLSSPLPEGKTQKKVLVLGWDGCRADAMCMLDGKDAVNALLKDGGHAYIAYCGGANYPANITQDTSTRPGWTSMFIGQWAGEDTFDENGSKKQDEPLTIMTRSVESGDLSSAAFYYSWDGHNASYAHEIAYTKEKGINMTWGFSENGDEGTFDKALKDVKDLNGSDFIFTIFEYCDEYGHGYGFWNDTPEYKEAFRLSNEMSVALIDAVKSRATYAQEDWLFLITSDHGGYARGHGGEKLMERMMFIITNK